MLDPEFYEKLLKNAEGLYMAKRCEYNGTDVDNGPNTVNDKKWLNFI